MCIIHIYQYTKCGHNKRLRWRRCPTAIETRTREVDCALIGDSQNRIDEIEDNSDCTLCLKILKGLKKGRSMASVGSEEGRLVNFPEDVNQSNPKSMVEKGPNKQVEPVVSGETEEVREDLDLDEEKLIRYGWKYRNMQ